MPQNGFAHNLFPPLSLFSSPSLSALYTEDMARLTAIMRNQFLTPIEKQRRSQVRGGEGERERARKRDMALYPRAMSSACFCLPSSIAVCACVCARVSVRACAKWHRRVCAPACACVHPIPTPTPPTIRLIFLLIPQAIRRNARRERDGTAGPSNPLPDPHPGAALRILGGHLPDPLQTTAATAAPSETETCCKVFAGLDPGSLPVDSRE